MKKIHGGTPLETEIYLSGGETLWHHRKRSQGSSLGFFDEYLAGSARMDALIHNPT